MLFGFNEVDETRQFGTEQMAIQLQNNVLPYVPSLENYQWWLVPGYFDFTYKPVIMWNHLHITEEIEGHLLYWKNYVSAFVFISNWQYHKYIEKYNLDEKKCFIVKNAITPLPSHKKPSLDTINIVYNSDYRRGLDILLIALQKMPEERNIRLHIFREVPAYKHLLTDDRIIMHGKVPNSEMRKELENMHMFVYPSTFPETSCISLLEAMSAGCYCLTSNYAALPETSMGYTHQYPFVDNVVGHSDLLVYELKKALNIYRAGAWDPSAQIEAVNRAYSWETRKEDWKDFAQRLDLLMKGNYPPNNLAQTYPYTGLQ